MNELIWLADVAATGLRRAWCRLRHGHHDWITAPEPGFIFDRKVCRRCWRVALAAG